MTDNNTLEHTPLPWKATYNKRLDWWDISHCGFCRKGETSSIFKIDDFQPEHKEANAQFVVTACNQHYELKAENERLKALNAELVEWMRKAEYEFLAIRARDGAPQHIDWSGGRPLQTSSCTHEYWDELTEQCGELIAKTKV